MPDVTVIENDVAMSFSGFADDHVMCMMAGGRIYEADLLDVVRQIVGEGGGFADFGAFIGTHTVYFSKVCKADYVITIEPNPKVLPYLVRNVERNDCKNVELWPLAVDDRARRGVMGEEMGNYGGRDVESSFTFGKSMPVLPANALLTLPVTCIKVDCEASTMGILRSLRDQIMTWRPVLMAESHAEWRGDFEQFLAECRYEPMAEIDTGVVTGVYGAT